MKTIPTWLAAVIYFALLFGAVLIFGCATHRTDDFEPAKIIYRDTVYLQYDRCGVDTLYFNGAFRFPELTLVIIDTICVGAKHHTNEFVFGVESTEPMPFTPIIEHSEIKEGHR